MGYAIASLLGILAGSFINVFLNLQNKTVPLYKWYLETNYKKKLSIAIFCGTAVLFAFIYFKYALSLDTVKYSLLVVILLTAGIIDFKSKTIPNPIIIFALITGALLAVTDFIINRDTDRIIDLLLGLLFVVVVLFLVYFISRGGVGVGDIKLMACVGLFVGFNNVISVMIFSTIMSGIVGLVMLIAKKADKKSTVPFAPFIFLGTIAMLVLV